MKVLLIGSGGREYAIGKRLKTDQPDMDLICIPGNDAMDFATCINDIKATEVDKICHYAKSEQIDYCVVTPDDPLVLGLVDALNELGIPCFGSVKKASMLEGSKEFAKDFMQRHGVPTAAYESFDSYDKALAYCQHQTFPVVIKADGLALGKGVEIVDSLDKAKAVLQDFMLNHKFGESSAKVVIEEFLEGPEISILSFCDSQTILPMISSMDHKKAYDGDQGPNTGGMGVIAPNPYFNEEIAQEFIEKIATPTLKGLQADQLDFRGCLYFGLMLTQNGLEVIEYNARFGDPETQNVLPFIENNLLDVMLATTEQRLNEITLNMKNMHTCCVVLACEGYPENPIKGNVIDFDEDIIDDLIFAGVKEENGKLYSAGGRVLNVLGFGESLNQAVERAYEHVENVTFKHCHYRKDIGEKALEIGEKHD